MGFLARRSTELNATLYGKSRFNRDLSTAARDRRSRSISGPRSRSPISARDRGSTGPVASILFALRTGRLHGTAPVLLAELSWHPYTTATRSRSSLFPGEENWKGRRITHSTAAAAGSVGRLLCRSLFPPWGRAGGSAPPACPTSELSKGGARGQSGRPARHPSEESQPQLSRAGRGGEGDEAAAAVAISASASPPPSPPVPDSHRVTPVAPLLPLLPHLPFIRLNPIPRNCGLSTLERLPSSLTVSTLLRAPIQPDRLRVVELSPLSPLCGLQWLHGVRCVECCPCVEWSSPAVSSLQCGGRR